MLSRLYPLFTALFIVSFSVFGNQKIGPYAISPITQKDYPKLYSAWGQNGVKRINYLMPKAAAKAAESPECDLVELVEISIKRSIPNQKIVMLTDCSNGKRFIFDEKDLLEKKINPALSEENKKLSISDSQSIGECEKIIKKKIDNSHSFHRIASTTSSFRAAGSGNITVLFKFNEKRDSEIGVTRQAKCVISDEGLEAVVLDK